MDNRPDWLVPALPEMLEPLGRNLAPAHVREIADLSGLAAADALAMSLAESLVAYAALGDNGPEFMIGGGERCRITGVARVWMLGAESMLARPARMLRAARWGLEHAFVVCGAQELEQFLPEWYRRGLAFVERLGFVLTEAGTAKSGHRLWRAGLRRVRKN